MRAASLFGTNLARLVSSAIPALAFSEGSNPIARFVPRKWRPSALLDRVLKRVCFRTLSRMTQDCLGMVLVSLEVSGQIPRELGWNVTEVPGIIENLLFLRAMLSLTRVQTIEIQNIYIFF
uniref:Uncharacterized protein n=1 Tax=Ixodes ricinus TaxID=34613 RepID=A0A6B0UNT0_IXORI